MKVLYKATKSSACTFVVATALHNNYLIKKSLEDCTVNPLTFTLYEFHKQHFEKESDKVTILYSTAIQLKVYSYVAIDNILI